MTYKRLLRSLGQHLRRLQIGGRIADDGWTEHLRQVLRRHLALRALGDSTQPTTGTLFFCDLDSSDIIYRPYFW